MVQAVRGRQVHVLAVATELVLAVEEGEDEDLEVERVRDLLGGEENVFDAVSQVISRTTVQRHRNWLQDLAEV